MNTRPPSGPERDPAYAYEGSELETFAHALRWKAYVRARVQPYLGSRVLEVGAGLGTTTAALASGVDGEWTCLEPDAGLALEIRARQARGLVPGRWNVLLEVARGEMLREPVDVVAGETSIVDLALP